MGIYAYAKMVLKADFKYTLNYLISIMLLTVFVFNGVNITLNSALLNTGENVTITQGGQEFTYTIDIIQKQRLFVLIIVVILFSSFCNQYFTARKTKEVGFAIVNGSSLVDLTRFLLFQNGVLFLLASIGGVIVGVLTIPFFTAAVYKMVNMTGSVFHLSDGAILYTFLIVGIQCAYFIAFNFGYVYRKEIVELLKEKSMLKIGAKTPLNLPGSTFFIIYLIPFIYILTVNDYPGIEIAYSQISILSVLGILGIIKWGIPSVMEKYKKRKAMFHPLKVVYLSNFVHSLSKSTIYFFAISISFWYFAGDMVTYPEIRGLKEIDLFILLAIFVVVSVALVYKLNSECQEKMVSYKQLIKLGYTKGDVLKIVTNEMAMFFAAGLIFPVGMAVINIYGYMKLDVLSLKLGLLLIGTLIIPILVSGVVCTMMYKKSVIKFIEEGK